jgi:hypothetical protein
VVLASLAGWTFLAAPAWEHGAHPVMDTSGLAPLPGTEAGAFAEAAAAGAYMRDDAGGRPAVYVVGGKLGASRSLAVAAADIIRDAVPVEQIGRTAFYLGDPANLLRDRPTLDPAKPDTERNALNFWSGVRSLADPVVLRLSAFVPVSFQSSIGGQAVAPGVDVIRGPPPTASVARGPAPRPLSAWTLVALSTAVMALLGAVGSGWAVWALRPSSVAIATMAVPLGLAALGVAGTVVDRLGLRMNGSAGVGTAIAVSLAGWLLAAMGARGGNAARRAASLAR